MTIRIAIVGSRKYPSKEPVEKFVQGLPIDAVVISGGAAGVDTWAVEAAQARGMQVEVKHADWKTRGRKAGPIRNAEIVAAAECVVAFWDGVSRGTLNTLVQAYIAGLRLRAFDVEGDELEVNGVVETAREVGIVTAVTAIVSSKRDYGHE